MAIKLSDFLRNPILAISDSQKRKRMAMELIQLQEGRKSHISRPGIQFEDIDFQNLKPENAIWLLVIQEILTARPDMSLMQWAGGPALVFTRDVDTLARDILDVNESRRFIIRGGSDAAAQLAKYAPIPKSVTKADL